MGKNKSQKDIIQYIYDDYIFNRDLESADNVLKHIDLLVDNNLASHISGREYLAASSVSKYKIASKMMCKYNKELKSRKRIISNNDYVNRIEASENEELVKLAKEGLDVGIYYADLGDDKHDDYAILRVAQPDNEDACDIVFDLYFIGYRHLKYKNKFFKAYEKYCKYYDKNNSEYIVSLTPRVTYKDTQFKSFDRMIFTDKDKILAYIDNWVSNIPVYYKYEMIPKLSILLYGEPGTGKSTFCKALAKYLNISSVVTLSSDFFNIESGDKNNISSNRYYPSSMIFALDDIDCICNSRDDDNSNENSKTLSALLEFLDNPDTFYFKAKDGRYYPISIVIATTNYYDKLDPAVKRYGRFDLKVEMKPFNLKQAEELCNLYDLTLRDVYHDHIDDDFSISPAQLQALCMENIDKNVKNH